MTKHQTDTSAALDRIASSPTADVEDVAAVFGVGRSTAYAAVKAGEWPAIRVRGRVRIPTAWVRGQLPLDVAEPATA